MPEMTTMVATLPQVVESTTQTIASPDNIQLIADRMDFICAFLVITIIVAVCAALWWLFDKFFFGYS